jgi:hypothetical protein
MLLSWPVIIYLSWFVIRKSLKLYEKKHAKADGRNDTGA